MTASVVKSDAVTNAESIPVTLRESRKAFADRVTVEVATTSIDEVADIVHVMRVPAAIVIDRLVIRNDDLDADATPTLAVDVGVYRADTGVVVDVDGLASAITTLQAANTVGVDIAFEAEDIANAEKPLWERVGLTEHPGTDLLISLTVTTAAATAAAGTVTLHVLGGVH
jgi:hypothetical protein